MLRTLTIALALALLAVGACSGGKSPAADSSAAPASQSSPWPAADTLKADTSGRRAIDSAAKAATKPAKAAGTKPLDHDRTIRPKFEVDVKTGKVTPIKRP